MYSKFAEINGLKNPKDLKLEKILIEIEKRKDVITSKGFVKDFSLPQFQDYSEFIKDKTPAYGGGFHTLREHVNPKNIILNKPAELDFNITTRGVFFLENDPIDFCKGQTQIINILGLNEKGAWLHIAVKYIPYSYTEVAEYKKQGNDQFPYTNGDIELEIKEITPNELIKIYLGGNENNEEEINKGALKILCYLSAHIYKHAKKLEQKLERANDILEKFLIKDLALYPNMFLRQD